jgi:hypothetical protein
MIEKSLWDKYASPHTNIDKANNTSWRCAKDMLLNIHNNAFTKDDYNI